MENDLVNVVHATPPTICPACMAACHELAKSSPGALLKKCEHTGVIVLAVGFIAGGQIIRWDLKGPCGEREAEQLALAFVRAFQPAVGTAGTGLQ
jgi:hypothetical protein